MAEDPWLWRIFPLDVNVRNFNNLDNILNIKRFAALRSLTIPYHQYFFRIDKDAQTVISSMQMAALFNKIIETTCMKRIWLECQNIEDINPQVLIQSADNVEDVEIENLELTILQVKEFFSVN